MYALITGASGGMGLDMTCYLAAKGYDVIMVARNKELLDKRAKQVQNKYKIKAITYDMDLSKEDNVYKLYELTKNEPVEVLINNAGFGQYGEFSETDLDVDMQLLDLNVRALHILTKLFVRDFIAKDKGYILNVASVAGFMAGPLLSFYYASKNYVLTLTEALNYELAKKKSQVKVTALCPGPVKTNFFKNAGFSKAKSIPGMKPRKVVKEAMEGLFAGKAIVIPGGLFKTAIFMLRLLPRKVVGKFLYVIQKYKG